MAQYQEDNYTNEDIKQFLLRDFKSYENKEKLNDVINQTLKKRDYTQCSQMAYCIVHHTQLLDIVKKELIKPETYKHSNGHYTDALE